MLELIRRIFNAIVGIVGITVGTLPTSADTVAAAAVQLTAAAGVWTWGAWAQVALAAVVTTDVQLIGITLENFVGAASQGEVEIGTGTAPAGAAIARVQVTSAYVDLTNGPRILGGNGVVARYRTSTGVADNVSVKLITKTAS
jgi:hypothetical protein